MRPWSFFYYHHQQQWTRDASKRISRLPSSLPPLTSTRGSRHVKNMSRDLLPSSLPLVLFLLFFSSPQSSRRVSGFCYNFSYFALFTYVFSLFLEVSHGAAALTHFSLTHIAATLLTHCTAVVLTHSIAILIALPHWCSIYSGQSCRLFFS